MAEDRDMNGDRWLKLFLGKILPAVVLAGIAHALFVWKQSSANEERSIKNERTIEQHRRLPIHQGASERVTAVETKVDANQRSLERIEHKLDRALERK